MLASFSAAALLRRNQWAFDALALALLVILVWQPASVLAPGFWFSFLAVGVIIYLFADGDNSRRSRWLRWGGIQFAIALALLPLSLFMFQQSSLVAPLANFIMVPYVSLLVVPLVLLAVLLMPIWSWASAGLLSLAAGLMALIWPLIEKLAGLDFASWVRPQPALWTVLLAMCAIACLLAPRRWLPSHYWRAASAVLLLPLLLLRPSAPAEGDFELHQLDVGQGLSVVVRTRSHALVYDTGARLGRRLDAGRAVVVPFLRQLGVRRLDSLVVSHGDSDHIGGAASVLQAFPEAALIGRDIESLTAVAKTACVRGQRWRWDGVDFEFLSPASGAGSGAGSGGRRNNHSCVLRVSNRAGSALLTGDVEHSVESELLGSERQKLAAAVLVVPHHGSKTSSSAMFIAAVRPDYALISAGYRNRYRLPAARILARYRRSGAQTLISGLEGTVSLVFAASEGVVLNSRYRRDQRHYWNHLTTGGDE
jgi:competence protein ComEC